MEFIELHNNGPEPPDVTRKDKYTTSEASWTGPVLIAGMSSVLCKIAFKADLSMINCNQ
jgi:hypothetical protein